MMSAIVPPAASTAAFEVLEHLFGLRLRLPSPTSWPETSPETCPAR